MLQSRRAAGKAIKLLEEKNIGTVYLYADAYKGRNLIADKPGLYRKLIRRLRARGIKTYALLGSWHLRTHEYVLPERRPEALAMLGRVLEYNASSPPEERFEGVNLDIEPHMLEEWKQDREGLMTAFLDLGRELMAAKEKSGVRIEIGPAVPFWLDRMELDWGGARKPASEHVLDIYDYAAVMDYRNSAAGPDGMIAHAASELAYASARGKRVMIGVEVTPNEVKKVTFSRLSEADMERELALAEAEFSGSPAFGGFVIHHFQSYRDWLLKEGEK